jgi:Protein of unknown function (DUF2786)
MNQSNEKIIDKIRKLLKLSESPNVHEAQRAIMKAQQLALKNGIEISEVKQEQADAVSDPYTVLRSTVPIYERKISKLLADNFRVIVFREEKLCPYALKYKERMHVVGMPKDVAVFKQIFVYTVRSYRLLLNEFIKKYKKQYPRRKFKQNRKNDYMIGFLYGLNYRFGQNIQEHGLVVITPLAVKDKIQQMNCTTSTERTLSYKQDHIAMSQGLHDAKSLTPHKNIEASA